MECKERKLGMESFPSLVKEFYMKATSLLDN